MNYVEGKENSDTKYLHTCLFFQLSGLPYFLHQSVSLSNGLLDGHFRCVLPSVSFQQRLTCYSEKFHKPDGFHGFLSG